MTVKEGEFLDPQGLADLFGISVRTIYNWRSRQEGPRGYRIGGQVRYRRTEVEKWLAEQADRPRVPA
jgi:excisionase family DNA binding protein